ncbi:hypothetical protein ACFOW4_21555 [Micromonospora sp. GCM10011542]|uniref:hypothetical protein n=1 Tax=Micromonospora sp. GCM10011542 TaxID=3317337 RepID=UPI003607A624
MRSVPRRRMVAAAVSLMATAIGVAGVAAPARAQVVESGTFTFSGDPGDPVSLGQSYSYATASGDQLGVGGVNRAEHEISFDVHGANGDLWTLTLAAPEGQDLTVGTFTGAGRYESASAPGLSLDGNGRGCLALSGAFTIHQLVFGPYGYVEKLDASFEQTCAGAEGSTRGEVHVVNSPAPAALDLGLDVATSGTASSLNGKATVSGTVTCTEPVAIIVTGEVRQQHGRLLAHGSFRADVTCGPGAPVPWSATVPPYGEVAFGGGDADVTARAEAYDDTWNAWPIVDDTAVVRLKKS